MHTLLQDVRYGLRLLWKKPGFTATAILSLALGIGAATAIFSFVDAVLLRQLPYPQPDRLVQLREISERGNQMAVAEPNFGDVRDRVGSFAAVARYSAWTSTITGATEPVRARVGTVSGAFFRVLGVQPQAGRTFAPEETRQGGNPVAVISHGFWQRLLGGRQNFSESRLQIDNRNYLVIGVMPPGFDFPHQTEVWIASELFTPNTARTAHNWSVIARLDNDITLTQAQAEVSALGRQLRQEYGKEIDAVDFALIPQHEYLVRNVKTGLWLIGGAVALLLLIACANVANLLLAQVTARQRELSVRQALGASRLRLTRQFVTECILLTLSGAAPGIILSFWGVALLTSLTGDSLPRAETISVNLRALVFTLGLALLTGIVLGLVPALRSGGKDLQSDLKGTRETASTATQRLQGVVAVAQVALTMMLLIGAGLLLRSFARLLQNDPGFRPDSSVVMNLSVPDYEADPVQFKKLMQIYERIGKGEQVSDSELVRYEENPHEQRMRSFYQQLLERLQNLPGVTAAGGITSLPLADFNPDGTFVIDNDPTKKGYASYRRTSPGYFAAMGIPLLRGRWFDETDKPGAQHVALISQSLARKSWPNEDPIGKRIQFGNMDGDLRMLHVVGVVGDVRVQLDEEAPPTIYANSFQRPQPSAFSVVVRGQTDAGALIAALRNTLQSVNPEIPATYRTLAQVYAASLDSRRFSLVLFGVFAAVGLLLAVMGIYSVLAWRVTQHTREIGIRMALGAQRRDVLKLIMVNGMSMAGLGVLIGIAGALVARKFITALLYGISATDPLTFAGIAVLLLLVAALACWVPARRATKVDPLIALRYE